MSLLYIKTKGQRGSNPLFFPANRLISISEKDESVVVYVEGQAIVLYQGAGSRLVYEDIVSSRKEFWAVFETVRESGDKTTQIKHLLESFPYLTMADVRLASECVMERSDIYLPLLPGASSRTLVEDCEVGEMTELSIEEKGRRCVYVCKRASLAGLPYKNLDEYKGLLDKVQFSYMVSGWIKGVSERGRILCYPPHSQWFRYTPELVGSVEPDMDKVIDLIPDKDGRFDGYDIEGIDKVRKVLDKRLKEKLLRDIQMMVERNS